MDTAPPPDAFDDLIRRALAEDRADDDRTTRALVPPEVEARAVLVAKASGVLAGMDVFERVFALVAASRGAPAPRVQRLAADGDRLEAGRRVAELDGRLAVLLTAERTALNLLQRASGVATKTAVFVAAVAGTRAKILATRKTLPGLRRLDLLGVAAGGGGVHRASLADGVLVKENHLAAARAAGRASDMGELLDGLEAVGLDVPLGVEVTDRVELALALRSAVDVVLLDNFPPAECAHAVELRDTVFAAGEGPELEASGGIDRDNVHAYAATGVERISVGAITHSAVALDLSLRFEGAAGPDPEAAGA